MNNFVKIVKMALKEARPKKIKKESLKRNDKEWKIIDSFLQRKVLEYIKCGRGSPWIRIGDDYRDLLISVEEGFLRINHWDIKRFCKQYRFKLMYIVRERYKEERRTFFYDEFNTRAYLIRVKHIL